jgi:hypothetical protein
VRFTSKALAQVNAEMITPGLDDGCVVTVVPVGRSEATETTR